MHQAAPHRTAQSSAKKGSKTARDMQPTDASLAKEMTANHVFGTPARSGKKGRSPKAKRTPRY